MSYNFNAFQIIIIYFQFTFSLTGVKTSSLYAIKIEDENNEDQGSLTKRLYMLYIVVFIIVICHY